MKAVVVYESWFGNTRRLAEAIAETLGQVGDVVLASVDDPMPRLDDADLLVVGAPTHIHGLSSAASRRGAIEQGAEREEPGSGVRGWLEQLPVGEARSAAVFDTRLDKPVLLVGSAAKGIAKRLRHKGFELVVSPESFFVTSEDRTPLEEGELERAREWAATLAQMEPASSGARLGGAVA